MSAELLTFPRVARELSSFPDDEYADLVESGTLDQFLQVIPDPRAQMPVTFQGITATVIN